LNYSKDVVAFAGLKRSGKDEAAKIIMDEYSNYDKVVFAAPLKLMCERWWGGAGIEEQDREKEMQFHISFEAILIGMWEVGISAKLEQQFINRVVEVFSQYTTQANSKSITVKCSYRKILQLVGTEVCRYFADGIWVDAAKDKISGTLSTGRSVIITDLRFADEALMLSKFNALVVVVVRDSCYTTNRADAHTSEKGIPVEYVSCTIENNGSLEDYKRKVLNLIGGE
jgi:hypothetical protein